MVIREVTYEEYKDFCGKIINKLQLGFSNTVSILRGNEILMVKQSFKDNYQKELNEKIKNDFKGLDLVTLDEFNKGVSKDSNSKIFFKDGYYKDKHFLIKL